ncbi:tetratricopeptide repeat-containing sensor histidine kinase [Mucilaginibacter sp.]|jgi:signal transduction histidine kinase|uniref:tetratricopeptide repeat-containing sensor histidine kinase n=1 Tax=Mucilaginibacter sp. TaxID=1882438 RepID=UPI002CB106F9|nr:tetratricopeptide repeat-containing sensor histidine kinase [Mucilaginibacter sp.]HTI58079.1 tetratricopeptide repeat-containing sensor histidine kinase [Mucilaginibacter sp.]
MRALFGLIILLAVKVSVFARAIVAVPPAPKKTVDSLNIVSFNIYLESPDSARHLAEKALILAEKVKYADGIGRSFLNVGHVYWSQSYYPIALFYFNKALMNIPKEDHLLISSCYNIIGRTYSDLRNFKLALYNLNLSEQYAHGDPDRVAEVYSERSLVYRRQGKYGAALDDAKKALKLNAKAHDEPNTAVLYGRLSTIYTLMGRYKESIAYSDTALAMSFTTHNKRLRATTFVEYAVVYNKLHDYEKAVFYAVKGGNLADTIGVVDAISGAYKALINTYEIKGDLKMAMFYQKRFNKMEDSLSTFNKIKNTELIQDYFALEKHLNDIADMERAGQQNKAMLKWQRAVIVTLAVALLVVVFVLFITYYFYTQKKKLGERLNEQNEGLMKQKQLIEVQAANLEVVANIKDKLLATIAHDLRTPLANLRNITDMFGVDYLSKEEVHILMKDINPMVKTAELTLSNLLDWAGSKIKERGVNSSGLDIALLGAEVEQVFSQALEKKNIRFINKAVTGNSALADENHIKVVLRNLVSNAVKFTDNEGRITLNSTFGDDGLIISVEDTGKGMSEAEMGKLFSIQTHFSQRGTSGESGTGIGLMLCKELVELNGGKLWISSAPGKGSKFYFSLPLNRAYA